MNYKTMYEDVCRQLGHVAGRSKHSRETIELLEESIHIRDRQLSDLRVEMHAIERKLTGQLRARNIAVQLEAFVIFALILQHLI